MESGALGEVSGIGERVLGGVDTRQGHPIHAIRSEGVAGEGGDEGGVNSSRQAEDDRGEAVLIDVVAQTGDECSPHSGVI